VCFRCVCQNSWWHIKPPHLSVKCACTGWRRLIGCLKLQVIFRKRATNYRAFLRKMTYEDKASYDSTPPCIRCVWSDMCVSKSLIAYIETSHLTSNVCVSDMSCPICVWQHSWYDSFHWKCHTPEILQTQKLKFCGTTSNGTRILMWMSTARYRGIWVSRFGGCWGWCIINGNCCRVWRPHTWLFFGFRIFVCRMCLFRHLTILSNVKSQYAMGWLRLVGSLKL